MLNENVTLSTVCRVGKKQTMEIFVKMRSDSWLVNITQDPDLKLQRLLY